MRIKITSRMSLKAQVIIVTIPISLEYLNYSEGFGPKLPLCYVLKHLWQVYNYYSFTYKYSFCCLQFSSDLGIQQGTPKFQHRSIQTKEEKFFLDNYTKSKSFAILFTFLGILICESLMH